MKNWLLVCAVAAVLVGCATTNDNESTDTGAPGGTTVYGPEGAGESGMETTPPAVDVPDSNLDQPNMNINRPPQENTVPDDRHDSGLEDAGASMRGPL